MTIFKSESELLKTVLAKSSLTELLTYSNSDNHIFIEPKGLFGIPDVVLANVKTKANQQYKVRTFAFEFKLRNWRRALTQAYRYRAFANRSYVVIDRSKVQGALLNMTLFRRSEVGLMSVDINGEIEVHYQPPYGKPFSEQMNSYIECIFLKDDTSPIPEIKLKEAARNSSVAFWSISPQPPRSVSCIQPETNFRTGK